MKEKKTLSGRARRTVLRTLACALGLVMLPWASMGTVAAEAIDTVQARAQSSESKMEMVEMKNFTALGGTWTFGDTITSNGSGDMFAMSDVSAERFIYEADVTFNRHSGAASLIFYAGENPGAGSYAANIDLGRGDARIFGFGHSGDLGTFTLTKEMKAKSEFHLRVESDGDNLIYSIDGTPVIAVENAAVRHGRGLGLLTYSTNITYSNVRYCDLDEQSSALTDVSGLSLKYNGEIVMTEKIPHTISSFDLTLTPSAGYSFTATSDGATITKSGNKLQVSGYDKDFVIYVSLSDGAISRTYAIFCKVQKDPAEAYREEWRSQFHFSPSEKWLNDPNGLVYDPSNQTWHLFYQYNPKGMAMGNQVWGHAVSDDLMHWEELDIAIEQDYLGAVFSGSHW